MGKVNSIGTRHQGPKHFSAWNHITSSSLSSLVGVMETEGCAIVILNVMLVLFGLEWGIWCILHGHLWVCGILFGASLAGCIGLCHLYCTKSFKFARMLLCLALCASALVIQWVIKTDAAAMVAWASLTSQLMLTTGGPPWQAGVFLLATVIIIATQLVLSKEVQWAILNTINFIIPTITSFLLTWHAVYRKGSERDLLEQSLTAAQAIAQRIINFDLDALDFAGEEMHGNAITGLLLQVASNLKLYRPYLPAHLLNGTHTPCGAESHQEYIYVCPSLQPFAHCPAMADEATEGQNFQKVSVSTTQLETTFGTPLGLAPLPPPGTSFETLRSSSFAPGRSLLIQSPLRPATVCIRPTSTLDIPHHRQAGTLLYVQLHNLEHYADQVDNDQDLENICTVSSLFAMLVTAAVKKTGGVVHYFQHSSCLVSWNFIKPCHLHAERACHAAITIRDRLQTVKTSPLAIPIKVTMGIWSGHLVAGTFGTTDHKCTSVLGSGVSQAIDLQHYAKTAGHVIVCNARVHKEISAAPTVRLIAVDVLDLGNCSRTDESAATPSLVYEVLEMPNTVADEWMYELQHLNKCGVAEKAIEQLWRQAQRGLQGTPSFQQELQKLALIHDSAIERVVSKLQKTITTDDAILPHALHLCHTWVPVTIMPQSPSEDVDAFSPFTSQHSDAGVSSNKMSATADDLLPSDGLHSLRFLQTKNETSPQSTNYPIPLLSPRSHFPIVCGFPPEFSPMDDVARGMDSCYSDHSTSPLSP